MPKATIDPNAELRVFESARADDAALYCPEDPPPASARIRFRESMREALLDYWTMPSGWLAQAPEREREGIWEGMLDNIGDLLLERRLSQFGCCCWEDDRGDTWDLSGVRRHEIKLLHLHLLGNGGEPR